MPNLGGIICEWHEFFGIEENAIGMDKEVAEAEIIFQFLSERFRYNLLIDCRLQQIMMPEWRT